MSLDIEQPDALLAYLRDQGHIAPDEQPHICTLAGGVSNRTVWVERPGGEAWVLKQALAKLRVSVDWFSSPERVHREALGLTWLAELAPSGATPHLIFEDHTHHLLAMQAVPQPHDNWKTLLLAGRLEADHLNQFGRLLGTTHRRAFERREEVAPVFADGSFFESLRLEPYYAYTAGQLPAVAEFLHALIEETRACRLTLVHGDYSPKNVLVYQNRLILLDHEVIHWGDPAFDLGFSLTHLLSKAHFLPQQRAAFAAAAVTYWQVYAETLSDTLVASFNSRSSVPGPRSSFEARAARHTLACLLARVAGRSPLEYLDKATRARQQEVVLALLANPPLTITELVNQFISKL
ncbi:MAG: aminoglycoside phosphotransferase family protein [Anaerolineae bacterium]|nr:aminoglycoside phosphotransferase family protein [Anaerolineae bacterium]